MRKFTKFYRLNYQIQALKVRLLDDTGKQIGVLDRQEALKLAQKEEKDLVEIAPNAKPPVVKLIDFKKFKYLQAKKEKQDKKNTKDNAIKEIRLRPFTGVHDLDVRVKKAQKFLKNKTKIKVAVKFIGRELSKKEFGYQIIEQFGDKLKDMAKIEVAPHFEGRQLVAIFTTLK